MNPEPEFFFEGFQWAVPTAFARGIGTCRFERGDLLYDSKAAYLSLWSEAKRCIRYSVQVVSATGISQGDLDSCFESNWRAPATVKVTDYTTDFETTVETTQGRLYSLLWRGQLEVLNLNQPEPSIPPLLNRLREHLDHSEGFFRGVLTNRMKKANLFLMAYDPCNSISATKFTLVKEALESEFEVCSVVVTPKKALPSLNIEFAPTVFAAGFAVDSGAPERIRDVLKKVLYKPVPGANKLRSNFRLRSHGVFFPSIDRKFDDLVTLSFAHGHGHFYRYRMMKSRLKRCSPELRDFLELVLTDCPNHFFKDSARASKSNEIYIPVSRLRSHRVVDLANECFGLNLYKSAHENLQMHFLNNDSETICAELPLWIERDEWNSSFAFPETHSVLTGHIDLLRIEADGAIAIWDYKPNAFREKFASAQLLMYALMLSRRTGIPISQFRCGYFDESDAFEFSPCQVAAH